MTGPKSLCVRLETQKYKLFPLVNRRVVSGLSRPFKKFMCSKFTCLFSCSGGWWCTSALLRSLWILAFPGSVTGERTGTTEKRKLCGNLRKPKVQNEVSFFSIRQEKRAQRLTFWVRRPPGGVGVFLAKGWWLKSSCSPSKVCLPWVSEERNLGCPGNFAGMSRTPARAGGVQKVCAKKVRAHFSFPILRNNVIRIFRGRP